MRPDVARLLMLFFCLASLLVACRSSTADLALPTPAEMEEFLPWVYPAPSTTISQDEFGSGFHLDALNPSDGMVIETVAVIPTAVCIELDASYLIEAADDGLSLADYLRRSRLTIDGVQWTRTGPITISDELNSVGSKVIDTHTGEVKVDRRNAGGPFIICWSTALDSGLHTVGFGSTTSSGIELSYSWTFYISP